MKFAFKGLAAHASVSPHEGRSALKAVELMEAGVNAMREHIREDARIHSVITNGGGQPNVVPPDAEIWYYIRANTHSDVEQYFEWVKDIARGAALMTHVHAALQAERPAGDPSVAYVEELERLTAEGWRRGH